MLKLFFVVFFCISLITAKASIDTTQAQKENNELKFNLNKDGEHYIKLTFLNQTWIRYTQNNPGSTFHGFDVDDMFDIGLRRTRLQLFGKVSDKVFLYTQFGQNNLSYNIERKQGIYFLDALGEVELKKDVFSLGTGLTGWGGHSRYSSPAVGSILSLDAPIFMQSTNDVTDQFLRKYSIYAKGKFDNLDYRVALSKPMSVQTSNNASNVVSENSNFSWEPANLQYHGYFMYQFMDKESNLTPYNVGTYLGTKSVFNIGAGFVYQKNAVWHRIETDTIRTNLELFSIDLFYDSPLNQETGTAITAYAVFSSTNFGKNYIRRIGVMNTTNDLNIANRTYNDTGNSFPMIGTGNSLYAQIGYLFGRNLLEDFGTLQIYSAIQYSDYEKLNDKMIVYDFGVNWLINGNASKISMNYQLRPIFREDSNGEIKTNENKGMFVIQYQIGI